jgi:multidrug efflux pump subunit AcrB
MKLTAFALLHWRLAFISLALIVALGLQALLSMPRSVDPFVDFPFSTVTVTLPGVDAASMEEVATKPIESALQGLDNVREVRSRTADGLSVVSAEYDYGVDPEEALDRAITRVNSIRSSLPTENLKIEFTRPRPNDAAILQLALVSPDASWRRLHLYADDLTERLVVVKGVRSTSTTGLRSSEVHVLLDVGKLSGFGLSATAVADRISQAGTEIATGALHVGNQRLNVSVDGAFRDLKRIENIPLRASVDGATLRVGDVAKVEWGLQEQFSLTRFNDQRAVFLTVQPKDFTSAVDLSDSLAAEVEKFRADLPPDIRLEIVYDQSREIRAKLRSLGREFLIALGLVLVTLWPIGKRPALIVMTAIPISLAIGIWGLSVANFGLNQITIAGFIIALGLVVDDSIVVVENAARHLRLGKPPYDAAVRATSEISAAVIGSTAVLVLAFLPLAFLPEAAGDFVRGLPLAVIFSVLGSLLVSLTIIPVLASRFLHAEKPGQENALLKRLNSLIDQVYSPVLRRALAAPRKTVAISLALCCAMLATVPVVGFSLFPPADVPQLIVRVELPQGSSVATTDKVVREVSQMIAAENGIMARMESVGQGNPQIFYNSLPRETDAKYGEVFITLHGWDPKEGPALVDRLRSRMDDYRRARVTISRFENGTPSDAPVVIRIQGPDLAKLRSLAREVGEIMSEVEGLRDIFNPLAQDRIDLAVEIDERKVAMLGVPVDEPKRALRIAISGEDVAQFRDAEGLSYPVVVRQPIGDRQSIGVLEDIGVLNGSGKVVPLLEIAKPKLRSTPPTITRVRLQRFVDVSANTEPEVLASRANADLVERLDDLKLPPGYSWSVGGTAEDAARTTSGLGSIGVIALVLILAVLVIEFRRFKYVLVVLGVIPLGLIGGVGALLFTGYSLSFFAAIGFVALIGIEIKNSILLVDFSRKLEDEGMALRPAIETAAQIRFLPVLLTSVTAIAALLPLALSGQALYAPLAWVIIGGLVSSTLLSRAVIPAMYFILAERKKHENKQVESTK